MILLRIDPVLLTMVAICLFALWLVIGYIMGYKDAEEGELEGYEEETR